MILIVQAAFVMTCAVRNANVPVIAFGQICLVLAPLLALSLAQDDWYARAIGGFVLLHLQVAVLITRALHSQNLRLVIADEEKSHLLEELSALNLELASLATTDALTGLANRRCFDLALAREWRRAGREEIPLGLLMVDVDHFKAFNDRFGHPAGDSCLALVAKAIEKAVQRPTNVTARYGGEEFAVLLPVTELQGAVHVAENVRRAVAALMISHPASSSGIVTLSIGAAAIIPGSSDHMEAFVSQADASLYTAKNAGRNRVAGREDARDKFA
jgi:diguanylate cyclase (GGDEF)-like protein